MGVPQEDSAPKPAESAVTIGPTTITLGHDNNKAEDEASATDVTGHEFGWDNEHLKCEVHINEFRIEWRPVTNGQFFKYYVQEDGRVAMLASWAEVDREMYSADFFDGVHQVVLGGSYAAILRITERNWSRIDFIAILTFCVSFALAMAGAKCSTETHIRIFRALWYHRDPPQPQDHAAADYSVLKAHLILEDLEETDTTGTKLFAGETKNNIPLETLRDTRAETLSGAASSGELLMRRPSGICGTAGGGAEQGDELFQC
ncbi:hypothetical protein B0H14DRAFT_3874491 [Mycena olivaceomarginata]|nr:hypothetical protein B0H14DRAFT_3874491 [Mycena olivaceomarginata]